MRVLAGGPARETDSALFRLHVEGLEAQRRVPNFGPNREITIHHELVPDPGGPRWHHEKLRNVAKARQAMMEMVGGPPRFVVREGEIEAAIIHTSPGAVIRVNELPGVEYAYAPGYDALLMVDTDVILGPGVLERMWAVDADVVVGVMWTKADWGQPATSDVAPQVWWTNPFSWHSNDLAAMTCWNALCEPGVNEVEIKGGGAVTLIRGRGFESHYWPLLESLQGAPGMWAGEDRTYCLGLETRGIRMMGVTGLPIVHLYSPELRTPEMLAKAKELVGLARTTTTST